METRALPGTLELAWRYAALIDDRRFDELGSIMLPTIRITGPGYVMDTLPEVQRGMEILRQYDRTFHLVGNQLGAWDTADVWTGQTCCVASHVYRRDGAEWKLDMAIRYHDRIVRHADGLRFAARELSLAWVQDLPLTLAR
jgi:SnoaL-like domain